MKGRRERRLAIAFFLLFTLVSPALAAPVAARPGVLQAAPSASQACFGYNGVDDSSIPPVVKSLRIAVVQPVFTSTPYSQYPTGSFYAFYGKNQGVATNVTTNLNLLSTDVSSGLGFHQGWGLSYGFYKFLTSPAAINCGLEIGKNVRVLSDMNVSEATLSHVTNTSARLDAVILPFSEYVTAQEYLTYERFVASGGTLIMTAHSLEYPVSYNATTNLESLVYAHGWAFHGSYASPIPCGSNNFNACPWYKNNTDWAGSNTCQASCFHTYKFNGSVVNRNDTIGRALFNEFGGTVFRSYASHEENTITNMTRTSIASVFVNDSKNLIAAYTHQFKKGSVVCLCVFGDDIIATDLSAQYFVMLGLVSGRLGSSTSTTPSTSSASSTSSAMTTVSTSTTSNTAGPVTISTTAQLTGPAYPTGLVMLGALSAFVVVAAAVVVLRRRQVRPG
jgi:hypothetical protein